MSVLRLAPLCLASLLTLQPAHAQQQPAKNKPAAKPATEKIVATGAKKMTREELRACMKKQDDAKALAADIESRKLALATEKQELASSAQELQSAKAALDQYGARIKELQAAFDGQKTVVEDWNQRWAALDKDKPRDYERKKKKLKEEMDDIGSRGKELDKQREELFKEYEAAVASYNERAKGRDAKVAEWNQRNDRLANDADKVVDLRADYAADCANRKYNEEDEIAIRQGK